MAEVVSPELDLVALGCNAGGGGHDAGVEHEDVEPLAFGKHDAGGGFDRFKRGEVEL